MGAAKRVRDYDLRGGPGVKRVRNYDSCGKGLRKPP
jgi:hypothetical protein